MTSMQMPSDFDAYLERNYATGAGPDDEPFDDDPSDQTERRTDE